MKTSGRNGNNSPFVRHGAGNFSVKDRSAPPVRRSVSQVQTSSRSARHGSLADIVARVLENSGHPMHCRDISSRRRRMVLAGAGGFPSSTRGRGAGLARGGAAPAPRHADYLPVRLLRDRGLRADWTNRWQPCAVAPLPSTRPLFHYRGRGKSRAAAAEAAHGLCARPAGGIC